MLPHRQRKFHATIWVMARTLLIPLLLLVVLPSCTRTAKPSLSVTAVTSSTMLNAENDVLGLVERYHAAKNRQAEYRPKVNEAVSGAGLMV